jgi:FKBP-type peptidyl-prolyl cis-trans isomerase
MAFADQGRGELLPPYSTIVYNIEVKDIMTKAQYEKEKADQDAKRKAEAKAAEAKEPQTIQKYLKDNKITVKPTASGLYSIEKVKGKGAKASSGKKVSVHYTGKLMDGTVFDTSLDKNL